MAAAVAAGAADAGLAVRAVARACDLDFVGVTVEPFELAVREEAVDDAAGLLARLHDPAFAAQVAALGGYDLTRTGDTKESDMTGRCWAVAVLVAAMLATAACGSDSSGGAPRRRPRPAAR